MTTSIREYLLINLLLAITLTTTITSLGNYYLNQRDIEAHLDALMEVTALTYQKLLTENVLHVPLNFVQVEIASPERVKTNNPHILNFYSNTDYVNQFGLQIWSKKGELLLQTGLAPPLFNTPEGFSYQKIKDISWRVFAKSNLKTGIKAVLTEHESNRNQLIRDVTKDDLYIMFFTFPLSGFLIWFIIGRGLSSLNRVAKEVSNRAPTNLAPVMNTQEVPDEIKPVIEELNKLFTRLSNAFERDKRFSADAAHELRTPLAALKTQVQVALNTDSINEKNLALQKVLSSVNRTTHIVQQLLTMSQLSPEVSSFHGFEKINLGKITREILAFLAPTAIEKKVELEFEEDPKTPLLYGNAVAISILVRNLVDNAIRYCFESGNVLVKVYPVANRIILEVQDNGPGISVELRHRVFERFFRVLGNKSMGSGLGLTIVKQISDLHGAKIILETPKTDSGLIVKISFPY